MFRRAVFDRRPIPLEIGAIENAISAARGDRRLEPSGESGLVNSVGW